VVDKSNNFDFITSPALRATPPAPGGELLKSTAIDIPSMKSSSTSLNHPNIAAIYGLKHSADQNFLVLELVPGETLAEKIGRGPLRLEEALGIATQIAVALEAAHEKGIIHRGLKPANIKVTPEGKVKVLDFGLEGVRDGIRRSEPVELADTDGRRFDTRDDPGNRRVYACGWAFDFLFRAFRIQTGRRATSSLSKTVERRRQ
jgi:serine/threonine protein kinase